MLLIYITYMLSFQRETAIWATVRHFLCVWSFVSFALEIQMEWGLLRSFKGNYVLGPQGVTHSHLVLAMGVFPFTHHLFFGWGREK